MLVDLVRAARTGTRKQIPADLQCKMDIIHGVVLYNMRHQTTFDTQKQHAVQKLSFCLFLRETNHMILQRL